MQMENCSSLDGANTIYGQLKPGQKQIVAISSLFFGVIAMDIDWQLQSMEITEYYCNGVYLWLE